MRPPSGPVQLPATVLPTLPRTTTQRFLRIWGELWWKIRTTAGPQNTPGEPTAGRKQNKDKPR